MTTAIVWDYTDCDVLLLTNHHSWENTAHQYCFPPTAQATKKRKRKKSDDDNECVTAYVRNDFGFSHRLEIKSEIFYACKASDDFAVLKLPKAGFTMPRIVISQSETPKQETTVIGYSSLTRQLLVSKEQGEIKGLIPLGFTINQLPSAGEFSGAAVVVDDYGHMVGYLGRSSHFASSFWNPQSLPTAFRCDGVMRATKRGP